MIAEDNQISIGNDNLAFIPINEKWKTSIIQNKKKHRRNRSSSTSDRKNPKESMKSLIATYFEAWFKYVKSKKNSSKAGKRSKVQKYPHPTPIKTLGEHKFFAGDPIEAMLSGYDFEGNSSSSQKTKHYNMF